MNWEQVVDHVYLASVGRKADGTEKRNSRTLLEVSGNNRELAIARLIASLSLNREIDIQLEQCSQVVRQFISLQSS